MRGNNVHRPRVTDTRGTLTVQGVPFMTIQGEGPHAGRPAVFVRLWGCHLACTFCDTEFENDPRQYTVNQLCDWINQADTTRGRHALVVITGGEPMRQRLAPAVDAILQDGHDVQIETAGSYWEPDLQNLANLSIVVSPKLPIVHPDIKRMALAWKYIIDSRQLLDEVDGLPITNTQDELTMSIYRLARPPHNVPNRLVYLQPMDVGDDHANHTNEQLCITTALKHGYRVSLQQHKILGVL